ncbi:Gram-negative bacteria-binding protein 3 [Eumeta japonica]|uniref:Gram-negative bacteria-binding protein 3 n=1 Tax=Eumeta variegata TaxID=151549 RepID=A0A4C1SPX1_EUMVA|nr:Gram-negative bacteria-binding protein 3 [Eumeta japonica]
MTYVGKYVFFANVKNHRVTTTEKPDTLDGNETAQYKIPNPIFKIYLKGIEAYIPHEDGITSIVFFARFRSKNSSYSKSCLAASKHEQNGFWRFEESDAVLELGDTIYYSILVNKDDVEYIKTGGVYAVNRYETTLMNAPVNIISP